jgi:hypothetical protein
MSAASKTRSVFAPVIALSFSSAQFDDLKEFLERRKENTAVVPISDVEQLLMAGDGRLAENGYRFNYLGFQALCNGTALGLVTLFNELSGEVKQRYAARLIENIPAAVSIYNTTVRAKIDILRERTLLVDNRERVIEGYMSLAHRMLDNSQFLDIVAAEMQTRRPGARFYRAELLGRELRVLYIDPTSIRKDIYSDPRHSIVAGWLFANQEDRGKSIHAVRCVLTKFGVATEQPYKEARLTHVGADIAGRTQLLVGRAIDRELDMPAIVSRLALLQTQNLGFVDNPEKFEQAAEQWLHRLTSFCVRRDDAKIMVRNAAMVGADLDPRDVLDVYTRDVLGSRTAYDLFCALLRFARTEPPKLRDHLQEVAMMFLIPPRKRRKSK